MNFDRPFDDADAEGLAQILAAWNGTLPEAMDVVRRDVASRDAATYRATAQMHAWKNGQ